MMNRPDGGPEVLTVTDLVRSVRTTLQSAFGLLRVTGEISNFRRPASGHSYFTLKDTAAQLKCVLFRADAARLSFTPQDGMQVVLSGQLDVYEPRGDLQMKVVGMRSAGEGALLKAFEQLKQRLLGEGLFDEAHKKAIPRFPRRVGVVTSRSGAALRDILTVLRRRYPVAEVVLAPVPVQGLGAGERIAETLGALSRLPADSPWRPDVLIVGRGGGSVEDLWCFNEEAVARAIFASTIPVVSAVGHETDVSIADFVADIRAATPSMAAEIVVPDQATLVRSIAGSVTRAESVVRGLVNIERRRIAHLFQSHAFNRPRQNIEQSQQRIDDLVDRLRVLLSHRLSSAQNLLESFERQLDVLDPGRTLERGYVRVERGGEPVSRGRELAAGEDVTLHFTDTSREARITS